MIGDYVEVLVAQHQGTLGTEQDFVECLLEAALIHAIHIAPGGQKGSFVRQVCQVGTHHTRCGASHLDEVDVGTERDVTCVNLENCQATIPVGAVDGHTAVETSGAQQGDVE